MRFPWRRPPAPEYRAAPGGSDYTSVLTSLLLARAEGNPADPAATAALECAAGLYGRAFAVAEVSPATPATAALTPSVLCLAARSMIRAGEALFVLEVTGGRLVARAAPHWDVRGGPAPETWTYRVDMPGPSGTATREVPSAGVLHFRFATTANEPWRGISPLGFAAQGGRLSGALETALAGEAAGPSGHVLPIPEGTRDLATLKADLDGLGGGLKLAETFAGGWDEGAAAAPQADWTQKRLGADPPAPLVDLHEQANLSVLAACGVPAPLVSRSDGTAAREAWRRFLFASVAPLGRLVAEEAAVKLDSPGLSLGFAGLRASDLSGRARALGSMTKAGVPLRQAMRLAGLEGEGDDEGP